MNILDYILIFLFLLFFAYGLRTGFIFTLSSIIGLILGFFIAKIYYLKLTSLVISFKIPLLSNLNLVQVLSFLLILGLAFAFVILIFNFINKIFNFIAIIPGLKTLNRLLGGIFSLVLGFLIISLLLFLASKFPLWPLLNSQIDNSKISLFLLEKFKLLLPILPDLLKKSSI